MTEQQTNTARRDPALTAGPGEGDSGAGNQAEQADEKTQAEGDR